MSIRCKALIPVLVAAASLLSGCASVVDVSMDDDETVLSTTGGSKEMAAVAQKMARDIIRLPQIANADKPPTIAFARVTNASSEPMDTELFLEEIRTLLMQNAGGKFGFLDRARSEEVLRERELKRKGELTSSSKKGMLGADFFLTGSIRTIEKTDGRRRSTATYCRFRLTDAESTQIIWENKYEFKKAGKKGLFD